jgi:hypothetical protein
VLANIAIVHTLAQNTRSNNTLEPHPKNRFHPNSSVLQLEGKFKQSC